MYGQWLEGLLESVVGVGVWVAVRFVEIEVEAVAEVAVCDVVLIVARPYRRSLQLHWGSP